MATQITNYQCPNCTGPLRFAGESGQVVCDYCDTEYTVELIEQLYADKEQAAASAGADPQWAEYAPGTSWVEGEADRLRVYNCPSCAAQLICDDTTAATACPYCGNPAVVPGQFTGRLKPNAVIPFRLDKAAAIAALKKYYKGKRFLPKSFSQDNHLEDIKGVYVPFWLFDGTAHASMRMRGTIIHKHTRGDQEITITEHYRIVREGNVTFEKVPADGSSKMPDAHMDAVEPFNYADLKPFSTAYLPGFMADTYDLDAGACFERANQRIRHSTEDAFTATVTGYASVHVEYADIHLEKGDIQYALLPVWMLTTKWKDKNYLFAMNGQTGKLIGDLPVDRGLYWGWFAKISLPLMAVLGAILFLGGVV